MHRGSGLFLSFSLGTCRLEGFTDPWEATVFKGRLMLPEKTLEECGVPSGAQLTSVRRVLVPEGDSCAMSSTESLRVS